ncbi:unnamed protein product, partial [Musa acuminata var. zebrina]
GKVQNQEGSIITPVKSLTLQPRNLLGRKFEFHGKLKLGWGVEKRKQEDKSQPSPALYHAGGVDPEKHVVTSGEVDNVGRPGECGGDLASSLDAAELEETSARSSGSIRDELCSLALTLGADDGSSPLLLCTGDQEFGSLGFLLSHLLLLNGAGELDTVGEVGDGHVIKHDVEVAGAADEGIADEGRDVRPLGEQLVGIELRNDRFKDLVADGREDFLVVLGAKGGEDGGEAGDVGAGEEAEGEVDHLQVLGAGVGGEGVGTSADVEDEGFLQPGDEKVSALAHRLREHAAEAVEEHRPLAAVHRIEGRIQQRRADPETKRCSRYVR